MKKQQAFPKSSTLQPIDPNRDCEFGEILEQFHADFHRSNQTITQHEDDQLLALYGEILDRYALTVTQWIKLLGELVVGVYIDPDLVAVRSQATSPFAVSA
jgi:hypothetical protein